MKKICLIPCESAGIIDPNIYGHFSEHIGGVFRDDGRLETNEVGIHEFVHFCELTGARPYVAANITGMTPIDMLSVFGDKDLPDTAMLTLLGGDPHSHNSFDNPDTVTPAVPVQVEKKNGKFVLDMPAASVASVVWEN